MKHSSTEVSDRSFGPRLARLAAYGSAVVALAGLAGYELQQAEPAQAAANTQLVKEDSRNGKDDFEIWDYKHDWAWNKKEVLSEVADFRTFVDAMIKNPPQVFFGAIAVKAKPGQRVDSIIPGKKPHGKKNIVRDDFPAAQQTVLRNPLIFKYKDTEYLVAYDYPFVRSIPPNPQKDSALNNLLQKDILTTFYYGLQDAKDPAAVGDQMSNFETANFVIYYNGFKVVPLTDLATKADLTYYANQFQSPLMSPTKVVWNGSSQTLAPSNNSLPPEYIGMLGWGNGGDSRDPDQFLTGLGYKRLPPSYKPPFLAKGK